MAYGPVNVPNVTAAQLKAVEQKADKAQQTAQQAQTTPGHHTHPVSDLTGILPIANGGTGVATGKAPAAGTADTAKTVTVTVLDTAVDFNTQTKTGVFELKAKPTGSNAPPAAQGGILRVSLMADLQSAYQEYLSYSGKTYRRESNTGSKSWTEWRAIGPLTTGDIGAAAASHRHNAASELTGVLPVANGGTGQNSVDSAPVNKSAKMVTSGGVYTALQGKVNTSTTVAGKPLTGNVTIAPGDIGAAAASHTHAASQITGVLPVANGGTGQNAVDSAPVNKSAKMVTSGGVYTALQGKVNTSVKVAGHALTGDVTITPGDIGAAPAEHTHDAAAEFSGILAVEHGGTGQSSVDAAPAANSAKMVKSGGVYTALQGKVNTSTTVAGKPLTGNVTIAPGDIGAAAASHTHNAATQITGILPTANGGTGVSTGKAPTAGTADVAKKLGTASLGSATQPIYLVNGTATACSTMAAASHTHDSYVPTSRTVNGKALTGNISLTADDVKALPLTGGTVSGTVIFSKGTDGSGTANNSPALIVGGTATGPHIEIDSNEIMAKKSGTEPEALNINIDGGTVNIGPGGLTTSGPITGTANVAKKLGTETVGSATQPVFLSSGTATACTGVMKKPSVLTLSLTADGWNSLSQTVDANGVSAAETDQLIAVCPASASMKKYMDAGVYCSGQQSGKLTFTCTSKPSDALTVYVTVFALK